MISIIIPVFNAEKYIHQAIYSIFQQTYKGELEVIVIDDGSTDGTAEIIQSFANVHYFYQENSGEAAARNVGLKLATGDYIAWLDADDWYEPTKIQQQLNFLNEHPEYDFVYCDFKTFDENTQKFSQLKAEPFVDGSKEFLASILFRQIIPNIACTLIRRKCIEAGCVYDERHIKYAPDYSFCLMLLLKDFAPGYIPEALYGYRRHSGNVTNAHQQQKQSEIEQVRELGIDKITEILASTNFPEHDKELLFAKILMKIGFYTEAQKKLEDLFSVDKTGSNNVEQFYLANVYYLKQQHQKAEEIFRQLLTETGSQAVSDKPMAEIYNNAACNLVLLGKSKLAMEYFTQALTIRADYMDATKNILLIEALGINSLITKMALTSLMQQLNFTTFELRKQLQYYH